MQKILAHYQGVFLRNFRLKITMLMKILLCTVLVSLAFPAMGQWVSLGKSFKPGEMHYFDPATVDKNDHFIKVWVLSAYDQKQAGGYQSIKSLYEFDCMKERARSYTLLLYPDAQAATSVIGAQHDKSKNWFDYPADSALGQIAKAVCGK